MSLKPLASPLNRRARSDLPVVSAGAAIPRVIHQTYFSPSSDRMRPELCENLAWIRRANPGWEHRLYGEEEMRAFVQEAYGPRILGYFDRINPGYGVVRADLFRYLLMYREGGVYLDVKSRPTRPLDQVIREDDCYLLSHWRNQPGDEFHEYGLHPELRHVPRGEFQQWHIVARAGHPFLRAVIERVLRNLDRYNPGIVGAGPHAVLRTSGPIAYTLAIWPLLHDHPHRMAESHDELGFEYSIFEGNEHRSLWSEHYSDSRTPITPVSPAGHAVAWAATAARAVRDRLRGAPGEDHQQALS